ncbi:MAG: hypothetical protein AAF638_00790 [Pseudomonadota bacterium]
MTFLTKSAVVAVVAMAAAQGGDTQADASKATMTTGSVQLERTFTTKPVETRPVVLQPALDPALDCRIEVQREYSATRKAFVNTRVQVCG